MLALVSVLLLDHGWRVVTDFLEHFHLLLAIKLPLKNIVVRCFFLESLEQVLVLFCYSLHLTLPHVPIQRARSLIIEIQ